MQASRPESAFPDGNSAATTPPAILKAQQAILGGRNIWTAENILALRPGSSVLCSKSCPLAETHRLGGLASQEIPCRLQISCRSRVNAAWFVTVAKPVDETTEMY